MSNLNDAQFGSFASETGRKESWAKGERAHFEYHCLESHDSADAQAWYRSHQQVTVQHKVDTDDFEGSTLEERRNEGMPHVYHVRFNDGYSHDAFEDELHTHPKHFVRPDPPRQAGNR